MNLNQLQITYQASADRLLLRVSTGEGEEFRFWLTRRLVSVLAEPLARHLQKTDGDEPAQAEVTPTEAAQAVAAFKHQQALAGLDDGKPFKEPADRRLPLGDEPILVTRLKATPAENNVLVLSLLPTKGQGLDLRMGSALLHGFCDLLVKTSEQAGWGLNLDLVPLDNAASLASKALH